MRQRVVEALRRADAPLLPGTLLFPEGVDDEEHHRDRDARVGYVKGRPGVGVPNVEIEKEKIDHVAIKEAIGEITQYASKQQCKREVAPRIRPLRSQEQNRHNHQRNNRNYNEESIVALERPKRCAVVCNVNQTEKIRHDTARLIRADQSQDQLFRQLIKSVEGEGNQKDELHLVLSVNRRAAAKLMML
jgi:hypothetical protein